MSPFPIDALLPWVDGADPALQARRAPYLPPHIAANDEVAGPTRFSSVGEVRYCVASIFRFAPFVRQVYIITDQQDPHLHAFIERHFPGRSADLRIIDHSVIFRGYEQALPVFNSNAIEAVMWNIPSLAEHVLYFNDDFLLTRPVRPEDFFPTADTVTCFGAWMWAGWVRFLHRLRPSHIGFKVLMLHALDLMGGGHRLINLGHTPRPLLKSWFVRWAAERPDMLATNLRGRFREPFHFQAQEPFYIDMARQGRLQLCSADDRTLYFKRRSAPDYVARKLASFDAMDRPFACFNSLDACTAREQQQVLAWMARRTQTDLEP